MTSSIVTDCQNAISMIPLLPASEAIATINELKRLLHKVSPMKHEPVDCVLWVPADQVSANDYNPNSVAPPEMELLKVSILEDGYTQPIVTFKTDTCHEVVDGFHRNRVGKECKEVRERVMSYLPVVEINSERTEKGDRIASTIRHNRARGKHKVESMSDIVVELKRRNWSDEKICRELGMDQDEVLRLCQITGLAELFSDQEFSMSWDVEGELKESDFAEFTDDTSTYGDEAKEFRTVNTGDEDRRFHTYDKWECYRAGFYNTTANGMSKEQCEAAYKVLLPDKEKFGAALETIITTWKHSCEHYLTNAAMNRIAWLGQAAVCLVYSVPSSFRAGWQTLTPEEMDSANTTALVYLNKWLTANGRTAITMEQAATERQSDIY